jgi:hypothetical protein
VFIVEEVVNGRSIIKWEVQKIEKFLYFETAEYKPRFEFQSLNIYHYQKMILSFQE